MSFRQSFIYIIPDSQAFEKYMKVEFKASPWVWIPSVVDEKTERCDWIISQVENKIKAHFLGK